MYLVVGLGNPGPQYDLTRHNVGFEAVDLLAQQWHFGALRASRQALVARGTLAAQDVLLCKPQTFMNESGRAVGALARFYKVAPEAIVVIHDELDFAAGAVRLKQAGGHGGHNGLRSIISHLDANFARIRIGIGKPATAAQGADFVLSRFSRAERSCIDAALLEATAATESILRLGMAAAMNAHNRRPA